MTHTMHLHRVLPPFFNVRVLQIEDVWTPPLHRWLSSASCSVDGVAAVMGSVPWVLPPKELEVVARSSVARIFLRPRIEAVLSLVSGTCASACRAILAQAVLGAYCSAPFRRTNPACLAFPCLGSASPLLSFVGCATARGSVCVQWA
jgi:hypothetical protein